MTERRHHGCLCSTYMEIKHSRASIYTPSRPPPRAVCSLLFCFGESGLAPPPLLFVSLTNVSGSRDASFDILYLYKARAPAQYRARSETVQPQRHTSILVATTQPLLHRSTPHCTSLGLLAHSAIHCCKLLLHAAPGPFLSRREAARSIYCCADAPAPTPHS